MKMEDSKRTIYAKAFIEYFADKFAGINGNVSQTFRITRIDFATFIMKSLGGSRFPDGNGIFPEDWHTLPDKSDEANWALMLSRIHTVRTEMNHSSHLGLHGDPPFEARAVKGRSGDIIVHNLQSMGLVTYVDVGRALDTYIESKTKDINRRHLFLIEHQDELPSYLQSRLGGVKGQFNMLTKTATTLLAAYIEEVDDIAKSAEQYLQIELLDSKEDAA